MKKVSQPLMPLILRKELQEYQSQLEASISNEDVKYFDKTISRLMDCIRVLLEEG